MHWPLFLGNWKHFCSLFILLSHSSMKTKIEIEALCTNKHQYRCRRLHWEQKVSKKEDSQKKVVKAQFTCKRSPFLPLVRKIRRLPPTGQDFLYCLNQRTLLFRRRGSIKNFSRLLAHQTNFTKGFLRVPAVAGTSDNVSMMKFSLGWKRGLDKSRLGLALATEEAKGKKQSSGQAIKRDGVCGSQVNSNMLVQRFPNWTLVPSIVSDEKGL